jgi:signal transduction histidine kinase
MNMLTYLCHAEHIRRVLMNLITNSLSFSPVHIVQGRFQTVIGVRCVVYTPTRTQLTIATVFLH